MSRRNLINARLMAGASLALIGCLTAGSALAADTSASTTSAGAEGAEVDTVIVTAEAAGIGAKTAPVKASLDQVQPESIVSHNFIEQVTPETGNISTVIFIAPSISGISGNAGGIGNYFSTTMRGFQDGFYNVTYDGIAFGDTNNPTHHPNDYFPTSTIGAAVVDRGPGAAGDLGQANYGGAIHYFSPDVSDHYGAMQKFTYGSFETLASVTTINTGDSAWLGGGKLLLNLDERTSDTELSHSGGDSFNQMAKYVLPVGGKFELTAFIQHAWSRYNFPDSNGPGETLPQIQAYGKDFQLTSTPGEEHYEGWNYERKQTYFDYLDLKYQVTPTISVEDQPYQYFYSNKTDSTNDNSGLIGSTSSKVKSGYVPAGGSATDVEGYLKRNDYDVYGDVLRFNDELPFGLLKVGALVEGSATYRQKAYYDFTDNFAPVLLYKPSNSLLTTTSNCKTCEDSSWLQEQVFIDFNWKPINALTISPGFKYVNFQRTINAAEDTLTVNGASEIGPIHGTNTYSSPLYFLTTNYKIFSFWSVYGQFATSFLIPQLSELEVPGVQLQRLKPETTTNYQAGTVFTRGSITADADVYLIDAANTNVPCNVPDPNGGFDAASCNAGKVTYSGVEGEAAYALPFGLTLFGNGSINDAKQAAQLPSTSTGIAGNPAQELADTPKWTTAVGAIFRHGPWQASLTYKQVGDMVVYNTSVISGLYDASPRFKVPSYDTINAALSYDFGHFELKFQGFNLLDRRNLTDYVPASGVQSGPLYSAAAANATSFYTFQSGRELNVTLEAKF